MDKETLLAQAGARRDPSTGAISMSIYPSAAFQHPALGQSTGFDYSRTSNPTRLALEETFAALEGGAKAAAFASGLAAIDTALRLFSAGDTIVVTEDVYGGASRLFDKLGTQMQLKFIYVDTTDLNAVDSALKNSGAKGLFVELPTNPLLKIADLEKLGKLAKKYGALFIVDNTFLTPVLCRPLNYGADITVYSATKYIGGHNDLIAGIVVARAKEMGERIAFIQNAVGAILSPFDSWLLLRSLKTLTLRLKKHQENAMAVAQFLQKHPKVSNLHYPGLPTDAGHKTLAKISDGFGAMISFEVPSRAEVERILSSVKVFLFAESLGGTESFITFPIAQTHANLDEATREKIGLTDRLLRLSIGLENAEDLINDLVVVLG